MTDWAMGAASRRGRVLVLVVAALGVLAGSSAPSALPASAASDLEVTAGYAGFHVRGRAVPVHVTVTGDRLLSGDLVAWSGSSRSAAVARTVEVAGGSVKRFVLVLPGGAVDEGNVSVELRSGSRVLARGDTRIRAADGDELVGLLPAAVGGRPLPGPAPLAVDAGLARFAALDLADLSRGPAVLDSLSAIGAAPDELTVLSDSARSGLFTWVRSGGHLLVSATPGTDVVGLPPQWQPGPHGRAVAGHGEVRLVGDAMAAGRWAGLVEPTARGRTVERGFFTEASIANAVARDAGLRLPHLTTLLGFLAVYVFAVGPLTAVVLRRRGRPELAWVAVPALAVVFTAGSYVAGSGTRNAARVAHSTVLELDADRGVATSYVGLTRRGAGTTRLGFPRGWSVERPVDTDGSRPLPPATNLGDDGPEAHVPLDVGQFGLVRATGPANPGGRLDVTASAEGNTARGTVRNELRYALEEVSIFVGLATAHVGRLEPGEERAWSVRGGDGAGGAVDPFFAFPGDRAWSGAVDNRDGPVNLALWQATRAEMGANGTAPGTAMAVGWTREHKPQFHVDGRARAVEGRTAIVARVPIEPGSGPLPALAVRRDVVRGPFPSLFGWESSTGGDDATVLRFALPAGAGTGGDLTLHSTVPLGSVEVWRDGVWQFLPGGGAGGALDMPELEGRFKLLPAVPNPAFPEMPPPEPPPPTTMVVPSPDVPAPEIVPPGDIRSRQLVPPPDVAKPPMIAVPPQPVPVPVPDFPGRQDANVRQEVVVPAAAVHQGVVFVRVRLAFFDGGPNPAMIMLGETDR